MTKPCFHHEEPIMKIQVDSIMKIAKERVDLAKALIRASERKAKEPTGKNSKESSNPKGDGAKTAESA